MRTFWRYPRSGVVLVLLVILAPVFAAHGATVAALVLVGLVLGFAYGRQTCNDHDLTPPSSGAPR